MSDVAETISVLLSTHIVEDVEATCPRLGIIARGRLLYDGEPSTLMREVDGCLWEMPQGVALPPGAVAVGRRVDGDGRPIAVVHAASPPPGGRAHEPRLEEAYLAFLAAHGQEPSEVGL